MIVSAKNFAMAHKGLPIDDDGIDIIPIGIEGELSWDMGVGNQVRSSEIEQHKIGAFPWFERAYLLVKTESAPSLVRPNGLQLSTMKMWSHGNAARLSASRSRDDECLYSVRVRRDHTYQ
jgi:hypothetical protein